MPRFLPSVLVIVSAWLSIPATLQAGCDQYKNNCVLYARCRVPSLPSGLNTLVDKKRIINVRNLAAAREGDVAIHDLGTKEGHVSVVTKVIEAKRSGKVIISLRIQQANNPYNQISTDSGTPESLKIIGYYRPSKN